MHLEALQAAYRCSMVPLRQEGSVYALGDGVSKARCVGRRCSRLKAAAFSTYFSG